MPVLRGSVVLRLNPRTLLQLELQAAAKVVLASSRLSPTPETLVPHVHSPEAKRTRNEEPSEEDEKHHDPLDAHGRQATKSATR